MASTSLIISQEHMENTLLKDLSTCKVARNAAQPLNVANSGELLGLMRSGTHQFFIKNSKFADDEFTYHKAGEEFLQQGYYVDQFEGLGHIKLLTTRLKNVDVSAFKIEIFYQSFFSYKGKNIGPDQNLKTYYSQLVKSVKSGSKRVEVLPKSFLYISNDLLETGTDIIEVARATFISKQRP